jgi:HAD superfamily hydrolase (TIGR01490 family)
VRRAAFLDLDGTLITVNTARLWLRRERRQGRIGPLQVVHAGVMLLAYRIGFLDMEAALRSALRTLRGVSEEEVRAWTRDWWEAEVAPLAAPGAAPVLARHRAQGDLLVLLTSSSRYAAEMATRQFGLDDALYTVYALEGGRFTGAPLLPICYGRGKVEVAEAWARDRGVDLGASAFYTDSSTDLPMLERVGSPFAVGPDLRLRALARARGWPILDWTRAHPEGPSTRL